MTTERENVPFAVDRFEVEGHVITIESYRDGRVDSYRQRNGSGSYNARKYTRWEVHVDNRRRAVCLHSRFGETKWEAYERARQSVAPTEDAQPIRGGVSRRIIGQTRGWRVVRAEMRACRVSAASLALTLDHSASPQQQGGV